MYIHLYLSPEPSCIDSGQVRPPHPHSLLPPPPAVSTSVFLPHFLSLFTLCPPLSSPLFALSLSFFFFFSFFLWRKWMQKGWRDLGNVYWGAGHLASARILARCILVLGSFWHGDILLGCFLTCSDFLVLFTQLVSMFDSGLVTRRHWGSRG